MSEVQRALVTGASGFIGRRLCEELLRAGIEVRALVHRHADGPWHECVVADIAERVPPACMQEIDSVFHLAGKAHALAATRADELDYQRVNRDGTRHIVEAAVSGDASRLIFFSSVKAMGESGDLCMDESSPTHPDTPYGVSKLAGEELVHAAADSLHTVVLRLSLVYGVGNKGNLASMLSAVARGVFPPLPTLHNRRSMIHVSDVLRAARMVARDPRAAGQTFILADRSAYSTTDIYRQMCTALGKRHPQWFLPLPMLRSFGVLGDVIGTLRGRRFLIDTDVVRKLTESAWYSAEKISRDLDFNTRMTLEQALPDMVGELHSTRNTTA